MTVDDANEVQRHRLRLRGRFKDPDAQAMVNELIDEGIGCVFGGFFDFPDLEASDRAAHRLWPQVRKWCWRLHEAGWTWRRIGRLYRMSATNAQRLAAQAQYLAAEAQRRGLPSDWEMFV